jgi:pre-mRNA-processing factor 6
MAIRSETGPRKARSVDALRKCEADPLVICTVARLYWADRRIEKAREWFERAVSAGPGFGDAWGWLLKFERQHRTATQQGDIIVRCQAAEHVTARRGSRSPSIIEMGESPPRNGRCCFAVNTSRRV